MRAAIADCYRIFARYDFEGGLESGLGPLEVRLLRVTPPAEVPPALIAAYCDCLSIGHAAAGDDFRAVLPRLVELAGQGDVPPELLRSALGRADMSEWPDEESAAVARCLALLPDGDGPSEK